MTKKNREGTKAGNDRDKERLNEDPDILQLDLWECF